MFLFKVFALSIEEKEKLEKEKLIKENFAKEKEEKQKLEKIVKLREELKKFPIQKWSESCSNIFRRSRI